MPELRTVFAGSPEFAATILDALLDTPYRPVAVFTQPDRPAGRGRKLKANPVKALALNAGLPVEQPEGLKGAEAPAVLAQYAPDILIVAAYGLILPQAVLDVPRYGCLNVHASLLPRWRGAAPVERAMMAGDESTGVCIMAMEAGLDTGPVHARIATPIDAAEGSVALEQRLAQLGGELLIEVLARFASLTPAATPPAAEPQPEEGVTYARKLTAADRKVDWAQPADAIARQINALRDRLPVRCSIGDQRFQPFTAHAQPGPNRADPGTVIAADKQGIRVACATNELQITRLRMESGKGTVLDAAAAINGYGDTFVPGVRVE